MGYDSINILTKDLLLMDLKQTKTELERQSPWWPVFGTTGTEQDTVVEDGLRFLRDHVVKNLNLNPKEESRLEFNSLVQLYY